MNADELENRLGRIPLRQPPEHWKKEILQAARAAISAGSTSSTSSTTPADDLVEARTREHFDSAHVSRPGFWIEFLRRALPWSVPAAACAIAIFLHWQSLALEQDRPPTLTMRIRPPDNGLFGPLRAWAQRGTYLAPGEDGIFDGATGGPIAPSGGPRPRADSGSRRFSVPDDKARRRSLA